MARIDPGGRRLTMQQGWLCAVERAHCTLHSRCQRRMVTRALAAVTNIVTWAAHLVATCSAEACWCPLARLAAVLARPGRGGLLCVACCRSTASRRAPCAREPRGSLLVSVFCSSSTAKATAQRQPTASVEPVPASWVRAACTIAHGRDGRRFQFLCPRGPQQPLGSPPRLASRRPLHLERLWIAFARPRPTVPAFQISQRRSSC